MKDPNGDKSKYSLASKARWRKKTPEERSRMMSDLAKKKHAKKTPEERRAHARMMVEARSKNKSTHRKSR